MSLPEFQHMAADAAAGAMASIMNYKRKTTECSATDEQPEAKKFMTEIASPVATAQVLPSATTKTVPVPATDDYLAGAVEDRSNKGRAIRLEQNRRAARESRRRKKVMIEELQRSVIFFSRANGTLKQQNDELTRLLMQAHAQVKIAASTEGESEATGNITSLAPTAAIEVSAKTEAAASQQPQQQQQQFFQQEQQNQAQAVATQALYESQGYPAAAARAAAHTMSMPPMQPGATMQAMANFQQAAAAAMQAAMQGMHGVSLQQMTAVSSGSTSTSQDYTDTMTALAMQQAAAAHLGQQFLQTALIGNPMAWATAAATAVAQPSNETGVAAVPQEAVIKTQDEPV